jgi:predicted  nucleic acid-binding Zn-ribbon protein
MEIKELKEEQTLDKHRSGYVHTRKMFTPIENANKMMNSWKKGIEDMEKSIVETKEAVEKLLNQASDNLDKVKTERVTFYEEQDKKDEESIKAEMYAQYLKKREEDLKWVEDFEVNKAKELEQYRSQLEEEAKHIEHQRRERIEQFKKSLEFYQKKAVYKS